MHPDVATSRIILSLYTMDVCQWVDSYSGVFKKYIIAYATLV